MHPTLVSVAIPPGGRRMVEPVETTDSDLDKLDHPAPLDQPVPSIGRGATRTGSYLRFSPYSATVGRAARLNGRAAWSRVVEPVETTGRDRRTGGCSSPSKPWQ